MSYSVKTEEKLLDLSQFDGIMIRVKGDGRKYTAVVYCQSEKMRQFFKAYPVQFMYDFETVKDEWKEVSIPFMNVQAKMKGRKVPDKTFNPATFNQFGIFIQDKKQGQFCISIDWIKAI